MNKKAFGKSLRKFRENKNMTQKELAERMNTACQTISSWECGQNYPDIESVERVCKILGITELDLFETGREIEALDEANSKKSAIVKSISVIVIVGLLLTGIWFVTHKRSADKNATPGQESSGDYGAYNIFEELTELQSGKITLSAQLFDKNASKNIMLTGEKSGKDMALSKDGESVIIIKGDSIYLQFGFLYSILFEEYKDDQFIKLNNPAELVELELLGEGLTAAFRKNIVRREDGFDVKIDDNDELAMCIENYLYYAEDNKQRAYEQYKSYDKLMIGICNMMSGAYESELRPFMQEEGYVSFKEDSSFVQTFFYSYLCDVYKVDSYNSAQSFINFIYKSLKNDVRETMLFEKLKDYKFYINVSRDKNLYTLSLEVMNEAKEIEVALEITISDDEKVDELIEPSEKSITKLASKKELLENNAWVTSKLDEVEAFLKVHCQSEYEAKSAKLKANDGESGNLAIKKQYKMLEQGEDYRMLYDAKR